MAASFAFARSKYATAESGFCAMVRSSSAIFSNRRSQALLVAGGGADLSGACASAQELAPSKNASDATTDRVWGFTGANSSATARAATQKAGHRMTLARHNDGLGRHRRSRCLREDRGRRPKPQGQLPEAIFGVSASAASKDFSIAAMVSSVSSPMFEMRKVFPFSFP